MARISPRLVEWSLALSGALILTGLSLILRAANQQELGNSLFSVWHLPLYLGVVLAGYAVLASANRAPGLTWRDRLASNLRVSAIGLVLFVVGFVTDVVWQAAAGSTVDVVALFTPTHLLAFAGIAMILLGPILSPHVPMERVGGRAPAVLCLALLLALAGGVTSFANPFAQVIGGAPPMDPILANPSELWSMRADGTMQTRLTDSAREVATTPSWSPDGMRVSHASFRYLAGGNHTSPDGVTSSIVIESKDGARIAMISPTSGWLVNAVWSPDGDSLAASLLHSDVSNPGSSGGGSSQVPQAEVGQPQANVPPAPGNVAPTAGMQWDVALTTPTDGGKLTLVGSSGATDVVNGWSPDGSSLLVHSDRSGNFEVYRIDARTGAATNLTNSASTDDWAAWSPDGGTIAFTSDRSGRSHVWLMNADGSNQRQLTSGDSDSWLPVWSPSGDELIFLSNRDGQAEVYAMRADGSRQVNLTNTSTRNEFFTTDAWSPDGTTIRFDASPTTPQGTDLSGPLAASAVIIQTIILIGVLLLAWSRRLLIPGTVTVVLVISLATFSFISNRFEFVLGGLVAGVIADLVLWRLQPLRSRLGTRAFLFAVPVLVYTSYFAALSLSGGLGWALPTVIAFVGLAGVVGLAMALITETVGRSASLPSSGSSGG